MKDKDAHLMMEALRETGAGSDHIAAAFAQLKIDIDEYIDGAVAQGIPGPVQKQTLGQIIDRAAREASTGEIEPGQAAGGDPSGDYDYNPMARL